MSGIRRLYRDPSRGIIAGVCVGIADYFDWNVKLIRAIVVVAVIFGSGFPILLYLILWYVLDPMPRDLAADPHPAPAAAEAPRPYSSSLTDLKVRFARLDARLRNIEECVTSNELELRRELRKLES